MSNEVIYPAFDKQRFMRGESNDAARLKSLERLFAHYAEVVAFALKGKESGGGYHFSFDLVLGSDSVMSTNVQLLDKPST